MDESIINNKLSKCDCQLPLFHRLAVNSGFVTYPHVSQIGSCFHVHTFHFQNVTCACLSSQPPTETQLTTCNHPCDGDSSETCGGFNPPAIVFNYVNTDSKQNLLLHFQ